MVDNFAATSFFWRTRLADKNYLSNFYFCVASLHKINGKSGRFFFFFTSFGFNARWPFLRIKPASFAKIANFAVIGLTGAGCRRRIYHHSWASYCNPTEIWLAQTANERQNRRKILNWTFLNVKRSRFWQVASSWTKVQMLSCFLGLWTPQKKPQSIRKN